VYITLLPEVVLQHGAHETTAGGRCERVQKQQSGIPVRPVFMHEYAVKLQTVDYGVAATGTNNYEKKMNFTSVYGSITLKITSWNNYELVEGKNM
jgi:hypothetical protein